MSKKAYFIYFCFMFICLGGPILLCKGVLGGTLVALLIAIGITSGVYSYTGESDDEEEDRKK